MSCGTDRSIFVFGSGATNALPSPLSLFAIHCISMSAFNLLAALVKQSFNWIFISNKYKSAFQDKSERWLRAGTGCRLIQKAVIFGSSVQKTMLDLQVITMPLLWLPFPAYYVCLWAMQTLFDLRDTIVIEFINFVQSILLSIASSQRFKRALFMFLLFIFIWSSKNLRTQK